VVPQAATPGVNGVWEQMFAESEDQEQIIERVAALDIGKAEVVCCVRLPGPGRRRVQEVTTHSTMVGSLSELANRLVELRVERVVMEATSDYWRPPFYLFEAHGLQPWHLLADPGARFTDLGADFYDSRRSTATKKRQHVRELEALGYRVTLDPVA
jgi:hypothetical protein